uniref:Uncharacterized protein n=1 Tax=Leclercia adecarboxylata TaxID=83655 RepID=A0A6H0A4E0_9ENTR|nr:hypothetical protein [Leclercia adecarboxylata]
MHEDQLRRDRHSHFADNKPISHAYSSAVNKSRRCNVER